MPLSSFSLGRHPPHSLLIAALCAFPWYSSFKLGPRLDPRWLRSRHCLLPSLYTSFLFLPASLAHAFRPLELRLTPVIPHLPHLPLVIQLSPAPHALPLHVSGQGRRARTRRGMGSWGLQRVHNLAKSIKSQCFVASSHQGCKPDKRFHTFHFVRSLRTMDDCLLCMRQCSIHNVPQAISFYDGVLPRVLEPLLEIMVPIN